MNKFDKKLNNKQGFTLVEVVVAMGLFAMVMVGATGVFASAFKSYKGAKNVNENLEISQHAVGLMTKTFRTSSIKYSSSNEIVIYDYSQSPSPGCIKYHFTGGKLTRSTSPAAEASCDNAPSPAFGSAVDMTSTGVTGSFDATESILNTKVGKVTVTMEITSGTGASGSSARIQSTASLRDYAVSNIGLDLANEPD